MSEKLPWFKFFASSWISDAKVRAMTSRQKGWYIDLLAYCWQEGALPENPQKLKLLTSYAADQEFMIQVSELTDDHTLVPEVEQEFLDVAAMFRVKLPADRITHPKLHEQRPTGVNRAKSARAAARSRWNAVRNAGRNAPTHAAHAAHDLRIPKKTVHDSPPPAQQTETPDVIGMRSAYGPDAGHRESQNKNIEDIVFKSSLSELEEGTPATTAATTTTTGPDKPSPTKATTNGLDPDRNSADQAAWEAYGQLQDEGVPLPPRYFTNEYGKQVRNPASERLEEAVAAKAEFIRRARMPVAYAKKVILDALKGA